jgi:hypothetical protein
MHIETPFIHHETLYRLFLFLLPHHQLPLLPLVMRYGPFLTTFLIHLLWIIKVYSSTSQLVTLEDGFDSIYQCLRTNITRAEFNMSPRQEDQQRASRAYEKRYRQLRNTRAYEEEKQA